MDALNRIASVDDHIQEHPHVWRDRLSRKRWGNRIPHVEKCPDGAEYWLIDELKYPVPESLNAGAVLSGPGQKPPPRSYVPQSTYDPKERLKTMKADGISVSMLYPSAAGMAGERFAQIRDPELREACVQAYNDWIIEEWAAASAAFVPQCIVPIPSVKAAVAEISRSVSNGHKGVIFPALPELLHALCGPDGTYYDPVWESCAELDVPLCLHGGCSAAIQFPPYAGFSRPSAEAFQAVTRPLGGSFTLGTFLFSGILLRHPRLKIVFADCPVGWGLFFLEALDYTARLDGLNFLPSELFRRQCFFTFSYESVAATTWKQIRPSNLLWSSHFPLPTSTWPNSRAYLQINLGQVGSEDRAKILWRNAADLFRVEGPGRFGARLPVAIDAAGDRAALNGQ